MLHTHIDLRRLKAHTSSDNTTIPRLHKCHDRKDGARKVFREHCSRVRQRGRYTRVLPSLDASEKYLIVPNGKKRSHGMECRKNGMEMGVPRIEIVHDT